MMKRMLLVSTLLSAVTLVWVLAGCQKPATNSDTAQPQGAQGAVTDHKVTQAEVGKDVTCPVMKTKFKVEADTLAAEYKGKVYYFCCPSCSTSFKAEPEKYTQSQ